MTTADFDHLDAAWAEHQGRVETDHFSYIDQRLIHKGAVVDFVEVTVAAQAGGQHVRDVVRHPGAVSVVPFDGENVILVQQYRAALNADLIEIPAGKRDVDGEPPIVTAGRELAEEVGLAAGRMELLVNMHHSPGFCDEYGYVFLATDLSEVPINREGPEEQVMSVASVPLSEAVQMCFDGRITDSKTLIGLMALALRVQAT